MKKRRILGLALCLCLVISMFTGFTGAASADDVITYTVSNGDYLFKICRSYGLDYYQCKSAIMALNGFTSEAQLNRLSVGQTIKLPASNAVAATVKSSSTTTTAVTTTTTVNGQTTTTTTYNTVAGNTTVSSSSATNSYLYYLIPYTVQYGDTLNSICSSHGTSYATYANMILAVNGIKSANSLWAGKSIYIPSTTPTNGACYGVVAHTVQSGQTATSILQMYGSSVSASSTLMTGLNSSTNLNRITVGQIIYVPVAATASSTGTSVASASTTTSTAAVATTTGTTYEITFTGIETAKGTPYAMVDNVNVSRAAAGKTVVVAGNSSTSYAIKSLTVYNANGKTGVVYQGNTFVMPSENVRVQANYENAYAIIKDPVSNGSISFTVNNVPDVYGLAGDTITFTLNPNTGFTLSGTPKVTSTDGTDISSTVKLKKNGNGSYSFKMPAQNVRISVSFGTAALYTLTWSTVPVAEGSFTVTANGMTLTTGSSVAEGTEVTVTLNPNGNHSAYITCSTGTSVTRDGNVSKFKMPASNVELTASWHDSTVYTISNKTTTNGGTLTFTVAGVVQNYALAGQTVEIHPVADNGYKFKEAFVRYAGTSAAIPAAPTSFVMPAANVDVYGQFEKNTAMVYTVAQSSDSGCGFTVAEAIDGTQRATYAAGETVYITPVYDQTKWKIGNVQWRNVGSSTWTDATYVSGHSYSFTMPASNVEIRCLLVSFENWVTIQLVDWKDADGNVIYKLSATVDGANIVSGVTQIKNGSVIVLTATAVQSDYTFIGFTVNSTAKNKLASNGELSCTYTVAWDDSSPLTFTIRDN